MRAEKLISGAQIIHVAGGGGMIAVSQFLTTKVGNGNAVVTQGAGHLSFPVKQDPGLAERRRAARAPRGRIRAAGRAQPVGVQDDRGPDRQVQGQSELDRLGRGPRAARPTYIFYALISKAAGIDAKQLNYLPHANTGDIVAAVLGGHAHVGAGGYQDFVAQVQAGRMRVLAVGSPERLPGIDAPTLRERGLDVVLTNWRGVSAHPSLSVQQLDRLSALFATMSRARAGARSSRRRAERPVPGSQGLRRVHEIRAGARARRAAGARHGSEMNLRERIGVDVGRRAKIEDGIDAAVKHGIRFLDIKIDVAPNAIESLSAERISRDPQPLRR